ncbi:hypothetical protein BDR26DRAFT_304909 [Obelidium mucronatum]|nr:hypothetical protein BDR26DRAFT_304909 [Obelidium mucronatum]
MDIDDVDLHVIRVIFRTIGPISILLNIAVIGSVLSFKGKRTLIGVMQSFLSISDIFVSITFMIGSKIASNQSMCTIVGTITNYSLTASSTWSFVVGLHCYHTIIYNQKLASRYWIFYNLYGWGVPFLTTLSLFIIQALTKRGNVFGDATYSCWIGPLFPELRLGIFYVLLWLHHIGIVGIFDNKTEDSGVQLGENIICAPIPHLRDIPPLPQRPASYHDPIYTPSILDRSSHSSVAVKMQRPASLYDSRFSQTSATESPQTDSKRNTFQKNQHSQYQQQSHAHSKFHHQSTSIQIATTATTASESQTGIDSLFQDYVRRASRKSVASVAIKSSPALTAINTLEKSRNKLLIKTSVIVFGFVISWIPATAKRITLLLYSYERVPGWLSLLMGVGLAVNGFWNSGVFFLGMWWDHVFDRKGKA